MKVLVENVSENFDRWLHMRGTGVGSSDIATICGMNQYESAFTLWARKTGKIPPVEDNDAMWFGREMEPIVGKFFAKRHQRNVVKADVLCCHDEHEWATASPDFFVGDKAVVDAFVKKLGEGTPEILEAKNTKGWHRDEWRDEPPARHCLQLNWQLGVLGLSGGHIAVIFGNTGDDFLSYDFEFGPPLFEYCLNEGYKFVKCVREDIPPDAGPGDSKLVAQLQGTRSPAVVDLDEGALALVERYLEINAEKKIIDGQVKDLKDKVDGFKARILQVMGPNSRGRLPDGRIVYASTVSKSAYMVGAHEYVTLRVK